MALKVSITKGDTIVFRVEKKGSIIEIPIPYSDTTKLKSDMLKQNLADSDKFELNGNIVQGLDNLIEKLIEYYNKHYPENPTN